MRLLFLKSVSISAIGLLLFGLSMPAFAQNRDAADIKSGQFSIITCGRDLNGDGIVGPNKNPNFVGPIENEKDCDFNDFIASIGKLITFLTVISVPLASVAFAWAGILYLTSGGSEEKAKKAKGIFTKVAIGFIIVLGAWLIVNTVVSALLDTDAGFSSGL